MVESKEFVHVPMLSDDVNVTEDEVSRLLGYDEPGIDEFVSSMIRLSIRVTYDRIQPNGGFVVLPISEILVDEGMVVLDSLFLHVGRRIASQLQHSAFLAVFVGTIGAGVEKLSEQYFKEKDMLEGYIYNLIGSEAAEQVAGLIHQHIRKKIETKGLRITNRFSPGYCSWDVAEQFKLFKLFDGQFVDVTLTDSALMYPVKSVSGVIGIGENVIYKEYTCEQCGQPNCLFSKLKKKKKE